MSDESVRLPESDETPVYAQGLSEHQVYALTRRGVEGRKSRVLELQRFLFASVLKAKEPSEQASCSRAYDVLEDRLRVLDGKLKPGSINTSRRENGQASKKPKRNVDEGPITAKSDSPLVLVTPQPVVVSDEEKQA